MSFKTELQSNNTDLQAILNTINNLPEAGSNSIVPTGAFKEGTISIVSEIAELTVSLDFTPDIFIATITDKTATSGLKTNAWVKSTHFTLVDIQNTGTGAHSFKVEDYTEAVENGIKIKRFGSYNIPVGTLNYQAYKK